MCLIKKNTRGNSVSPTRLARKVYQLLGVACIPFQKSKEKIHVFSTRLRCCASVQDNSVTRYIIMVFTIFFIRHIFFLSTVIPKTWSSSPVQYNTICINFQQTVQNTSLSLSSRDNTGPWVSTCYSRQLSFCHVTLTARRSRLGLTHGCPTQLYYHGPSLTSLSHLLTLLFLVCPLWTATSGGVNPRAMGSEGTNRCNAYSIYSPDAKDRVTQTEKKNLG